MNFKFIKMILFSIISINPIYSVVGQIKREERDFMNNNKYMTVNDVYSLLSELAESHAVYSRMKLDMEKDWDVWIKIVEERQFAHHMEFIKWVWGIK